MSQIVAERMRRLPSSSRGSFVVVQQATESLTPVAPSLASKRATFDEPILEPLVIPLATVVIDELRKHPSKVALAERYYLIEALVFDRPHEPFGVRVRIGRLKRRLSRRRRPRRARFSSSKYARASCC
jgi:hypothetical protein